MNLKDTLNLPRTDFPMRASLPQNEPKRIEKWEASNLYEKIQEKNKGKERFTMPDGPPYANGNIHLGHVLNKVLKDITLKYRSLKGNEAPFIPGWDGHGLPIELKVTKELGPKKNEMTKKQIRDLCRKEAFKWVGKQKDQFRRLGVFADWENPYITVHESYEAEEVRELARIYEKGLIYKGQKPVFWCPVMQTALADTEVEYQDHVSPSIFVKFKVQPESLNGSDLGTEEEVFAVIWTTTPWTLPANLAIAVHPDFEYQVYKSEKGNLLLAKELADFFTKETGIELEAIGATVKGLNLENLVADHPFIKRESRFILGNHVTLEAGTGLVHTAPGHGADDYIVGLQYGLEVYSPVGPDGRYTKDFPEMQGEFIFDANDKIVESLQKSEALLFHKKFKHSYPHNWRTKTPLIFRATPQWFLKVDDKQINVRKMALEKSESEIKFYPEWGQARLNGMLSNRPDWCLSRQRIWGVPLPVLICASCGEPHTSADFMYAVADKMEKEGGLDAYFEGDLSDIAPAKCEHCNSTDFNKGEDILDVWFDSGVCHAAVQRKREGMNFPADIYLEGSDQHRGWFQTSLLSSLAAHQEAPFKALVTHGFVNDAKGRKMSKSLGNVIDPLDIMKQSGAEILRLWVSSEDYGQDVNVSKEIFSRVTETYRRIRNTMRFMLGNLEGYTYVELKPEDLDSLDHWAMIKLNRLIDEVTEAYESFNYYKAYHALNLFFTVDLSSRYLDILKDRLYVESKTSKVRLSSQFVICRIIETTSILMAPILSFLGEEVYSYLPRENKKESVFLEGFPKAEPLFNDETLESDYEKLFESRALVSKALEELRNEKVIKGSLEAQAILCPSVLDRDLWEKYKSHLAEFYIVSQVSYDADLSEVVVKAAEGEKCPRCWHVQKLQDHKIGEKVCARCVNVLDELI